MNEIHRNIYVHLHEIFDIVFKKKKKQQSKVNSNNKLTHHNTMLDNNFYKISVNYEDLVVQHNIHMMI